MKHILIEHPDGNDPTRLTVFDTLADRARATRALILGPPTDDNKDTQCHDLIELATEGIVHFEGEPPLQWIDAEVVFNDPVLKSREALIYELTPYVLGAAYSTTDDEKQGFIGQIMKCVMPAAFTRAVEGDARLNSRHSTMSPQT